MKIIVYGVHHWNDNAPDKKTKQYCKEWYDRIIKNIPNVSEVFVTTGSHSNPNKSPFPKKVSIIQNKIPYTQPYTLYHNYFRNGFMTGIWHALLNISDWDILLHVQSRVLVGDNLTKQFQDFQNSSKQVICPSLIQQGINSMEISFFGMKPAAVMKYATGGHRPSFHYDSTEYTYNCEEEAYLMFHKTWFNPWPEIITTRQLDKSCRSVGLKTEHSPFSLFNLRDIEKLPVVSTGIHILPEYLQHWKNTHPYES